MNKQELKDRMFGDLLGAAIHELKSREVPQGPPSELLILTHSQVQDDQSSGVGRRANTGSPRFSRSFLMKSYTVAACLAISLGLLSLIQPSNYAFAAVQEEIRKAKTLKYVISVYPKDQTEPPTRMLTMVSAEGRLRMETEDATIVNIFDEFRGEHVIINRHAKTLFRISMEKADISLRSETSWIEAFKTIGPDEGVEIGSKKMEGREVVGYRANLGGDDFEIWVDEELGDLVQMTCNGKGFSDDIFTRVAFTDFEFSQLPSPELFSTDLPAGYTETKIELAVEGEDDVINIVEALTEYSTLMNGEFPNDIRNPTRAIHEISERIDSRDRLMKLASRLGSVQGYLMSLDEGVFQYRGNGQKVGDGEKIVFWVREEGRIRAIFDDLSVRYVTELDIK